MEGHASDSSSDEEAVEVKVVVEQPIDLLQPPLKWIAFIGIPLHFIWGPRFFPCPQRLDMQLVCDRIYVSTTFVITSIFFWMIIMITAAREEIDFSESEKAWYSLEIVFNLMVYSTNVTLLYSMQSLAEHYVGGILVVWLVLFVKFFGDVGALDALRTGRNGVSGDTKFAFAIILELLWLFIGVVPLVVDCASSIHITYSAAPTEPSQPPDSSERLVGAPAAGERATLRDLASMNGTHTSVAAVSPSRSSTTSIDPGESPPTSKPLLQKSTHPSSKILASNHQYQSVDNSKNKSKRSPNTMRKTQSSNGFLYSNNPSRSRQLDQVGSASQSSSSFESYNGGAESVSPVSITSNGKKVLPPEKRVSKIPQAPREERFSPPPAKATTKQSPTMSKMVPPEKRATRIPGPSSDLQLDSSQEDSPSKSPTTMPSSSKKNSSPGSTRDSTDKLKNITMATNSSVSSLERAETEADRERIRKEKEQAAERERERELARERERQRGEEKRRALERKKRAASLAERERERRKHLALGGAPATVSSPFGAVASNSSSGRFSNRGVPGTGEGGGSSNTTAHGRNTASLAGGKGGGGGIGGAGGGSRSHRGGAPSNGRRPPAAQVAASTQRKMTKGHNSQVYPLVAPPPQRKKR